VAKLSKRQTIEHKGINQKRYLKKGAEIRGFVDETTNKRYLEGYAALFNSKTHLTYWSEEIAMGAFKKTINDGADVRALFNHDSNLILGRTKSGTLEIKEDEKGLWYRVELPDTSYARDLIASIERGDITQNSFAFEIIKEDYDEERDLFVIREARLYDVSPVTYPAYEDTTLALRSAYRKLGIADDIALKVLNDTLTDEEKIEIRSKLDDVIKSDMPQEAHNDTNIDQDDYINKERERRFRRLKLNV